MPPTDREDTDSASEGEAWFQEERARLTPERLRHLLRLDTAWKRFAARVHDHLTAFAVDPRAVGKDGDNAIQLLIQRELWAFVDLLIEMGVPRALITPILRVLVAFQARRDNTYDSLVTATGSNRPHWVVQEFRAHVVAAVATLYDAGTDLKSALAAVRKEVEKIYREESLGPLLGDPPEIGSIRGWYEDRGDANTQLGQFYAGLRDHVPPNLSPDERVTWLLQNGSVRCRYVGPVIRKDPTTRKAPRSRKKVSRRS